MCGAPAMLATLIDNDNKRCVTNLCIITAGVPPSPTIITHCKNIGAEIMYVYSPIESYGLFAVCEPQPDWKGMTVCHRAVPKARQGVTTVTNQDARIVEQSGALNAPLADVPNGGTIVDEIIMIGNGVMNGYFKDSGVIEHALHGGWFHAGGLGVMHPDDYIQLLDRVKDVIISGGENISTTEVEQAVVSYPDVSDYAVTGVPDDKWGECPRAYVVLRPEAHCQSAAEGVAEHSKNVAEAVITHCRAHIVGYKIPYDVIVIGELPRTSMSRVRENKLCDLAWASGKIRIKG